jgi:hypothetical protein
MKLELAIWQPSYIGWVHLDDLLLWNECPQTKDGISRKIVIVKDYEEITQQNVNKITATSTRLYHK